MPKRERELETLSGRFNETETRVNEGNIGRPDNKRLQSRTNCDKSSQGQLNDSTLLPLPPTRNLAL